MSETGIAEVVTPAAVETPAVQTPAAPGSGFLATQATPAATATPATITSIFGDGVQKEGKFTEGWTSALAEKHPALANQMMRYQTEADAVAGLDNLVKMVGKKTAGIAYPKEGATPEDIAAFRADAGVPGRAEEYKLKPETLPEGVQWDDATGKQFAELMHANHIPAPAAQALVAAHLETLAKQGAGEIQAREAKLAESVAKSTAEFQREWGAGFHDRLNANTDFINARLSAEDVADPALKLALSHPAIVRIIDEARRASREAPLPGANSTAVLGSMSPQQQAMDIIKGNPQWRKDPDTARRVNDLYAQHAQAEKRRSS